MYVAGVVLACSAAFQIRVIDVYNHYQIRIAQSWVFQRSCIIGQQALMFVWHVSLLHQRSPQNWQFIHSAPLEQHYLSDTQNIHSFCANEN